MEATAADRQGRVQREAATAGAPAATPMTATFIVLGIGESGAHETVTKIGGWLGLATAVAAWYASFAAVTTATFGRSILPNPPLNR